MTVRQFVTRPRQWTRTDPRFIRRILNHAEQIGVVPAAEVAGLDFTQVYRWREWREQHGDWPNDHDIACWDAWEAAHAEHRRRVNASLKRRTLARRHLTEPSVGTQRRLQALFALGWRYADIGARMGVQKGRIAQLINSPSPRVLVRTANAARRAYDALSMTVPQGRTFDRQRRWAARRGFAPPLAWDDDTIDDPKARAQFGPAYSPRGYDEAVVLRFVESGHRPRPLSHAEAAEACRRLLRAGRSTFEIEHVYGIKPERYKEDQIA